MTSRAKKMAKYILENWSASVFGTIWQLLSKLNIDFRKQPKFDSYFTLTNAVVIYIWNISCKYHVAVSCSAVLHPQTWCGNKYLHCFLLLPTTQSNQENNLPTIIGQKRRQKLGNEDNDKHQKVKHLYPFLLCSQIPSCSGRAWAYFLPANFFNFNS